MFNIYKYVYIYYIYVSLSLWEGGLSLSRVLWKSAYSRSFHACIFLSLCIHVLSCSFHVPFIGIHVHSFSFHIPFVFIPMCIHVLSSSFHLHAFSFHFAFMSVHVLSKVMEWFYGLAKQPSATNGYRKVIAKVIAK